MALYVLQGSVSLMAQHLKEGHDKLPLVLPICIYHGKISPYPNSADIFDHFEDPDLARALVFKPFSLVDLTTMTEEAIKQHGAAALMELLFKWYSARNLLEVLKQSTDGAVWRLTLSRTTEPYFEAVLEYLCSTGNQNQSADELKEFLSKLLPEKRESVMNFAQQLERRGEQKGYQKALQATYADAWRAAQQEAEHKTKIKTARRMLNAGFPMESVKLVTDLEERDLAALRETDQLFFPFLQFNPCLSSPPPTSLRFFLRFSGYTAFKKYWRICANLGASDGSLQIIAGVSSRNGENRTISLKRFHSTIMQRTSPRSRLTPSQMQKSTPILLPTDCSCQVDAYPKLASDYPTRNCRFQKRIARNIKNRLHCKRHNSWNLVRRH